MVEAVWVVGCTIGTEAAMMEVLFVGQNWTGSLAFDADSVMVYVTPSDLDAAPHMSVVALDPTPDQADAIAAGWAEWAARRRAERHRNAQPDLLVLLQDRS